MGTGWISKAYNSPVKLGVYLLLTVSLAVGVIVSIVPLLGIFLTGVIAALCLSWGILIGLGAWRRYSYFYVILWLFSILSGNVYLLSLGSAALWLSLSDLFLIFSLVVVVYEYRRVDLKRGPTLIIGVLMAFLTISFFRGLMAAAPTRALAGVKAVTGGLLFFMIAEKVRLDDRVIEKLFLALYIWACCFLLFILRFILMTAQDYGFSIVYVVLNKVDYSTPLGRTNYLASIALFLWPLVFFGTLMVSRGFQKILGIIALCALVGTLFLVFSRGALIAFGWALPVILSVGFYQFVRRSRYLRGLIVFSIVTTLLVGGITIASWSWLKPIGEAVWRLLTSPSTWVEYRSAQARFQLWQNAVDAFVQSPLLGQGLYNVIDINPATEIRLLVHNLPLQLLSETGVVGFSLYSLALFIAAFCLLKKFTKYRRTPTRAALCIGVLAGLFVSLLHSMVEANFLTRDFDLLFWGILGLALNERGVQQNCEEMYRAKSS